MPSRRSLLTAGAALLLAGCGGGGPAWHSTNVSGAVPDLSFTLTRATTGQTVTAADYRGKITLLYFGYTYCPDVCPMTLSHLAQALREAGPGAADVRVLFVTVDPARDTPHVLAQYVQAFGPQFQGLRGSNDALAALAKRYRVAYSVTPNADPDKYVVTHSSAVYAFDRQGHAKLLISTLSQLDPDIAGTAADLKRLIAG